MELKNKMNQKQKQAKVLRVFRKIHRITAAYLFVFFFIMAATGLLLGLKKNSGGLIQAKTQKGTSKDLSEWLPLDSLHKNACKFLHEQVSDQLSLKIDRLDVRKEKGIVKVIFADHFWALQLDGVTGDLLTIEQRRSDYIEMMHDGSLLDFYLGTKGDPIKVVYSSIMGLALLLFTITGFWLWYGPKRMKKKL